MGYAFFSGCLPSSGTARARVKTLLKPENRTIAPVPPVPWGKVITPDPPPLREAPRLDLGPQGLIKKFPAFCRNPVAVNVYRQVGSWSGPTSVGTLPP
jgi:hypothetical protein